MEKESNEERDFLLWRYFHQDLTPEEARDIQQKLKTSPEWEAAFHQIEREEKQFSLMETEQPSMRFTQNVMDHIANTAIIPSSRTYINTRMIKWIGMGMVAIVAFFLIYTLALIPWHSTDGHTEASLPLPTVSINTAFLSSHYWLYGSASLLLFCVILFLSKVRETGKKLSHS